MTSMRLAYGDPNVLKCSVQFAYDRFFTKFDYEDSNQAVINTSSGVVNSNDVGVVEEVIPQYQINRNNLNASRNKSNSTPYVNPATNYKNRRKKMGRG